MGRNVASKSFISMHNKDNFSTTKLKHFPGNWVHKLLAFFNSFFSSFKEKRMVISTHKRSSSIVIPSYLQVFLFGFISIFLAWSCVYLFSVIRDKKNIDSMKDGITQLRSANQELIKHIDKINTDMDRFNEEVNQKMSRRQEKRKDISQEVAALANSGQHNLVAKIVIADNFSNLSRFINNTNIYLSYVVRSIESLGLGYEAFISQYPEFRNIKIVKNLDNIADKNNISEDEKYQKYGRFYFFSSDILNKKMGLKL
jgi:hypothetical protein